MHNTDDILINSLATIYYNISHITYFELPRYRRNVRNLENTEDIRIKYILGEIDKKEVGTKIYQIDIKRKVTNTFLQIIELISVVAIENFNILYNASLKKETASLKTPKDYYNFVEDKIVILNNLRVYCNEEFSKISTTYNRTVMFIDDTQSTACVNVISEQNRAY